MDDGDFFLWSTILRMCQLKRFYPAIVAVLAGLSQGLQVLLGWVTLYMYCTS
jgi:hypothetical protein